MKVAEKRLIDRTFKAIQERAITYMSLYLSAQSTDLVKRGFDDLKKDLDAFLITSRYMFRDDQKALNEVDRQINTTLDMLHQFDMIIANNVGFKVEFDNQLCSLVISPVDEIWPDWIIEANIAV